jgi:integrase
LEAAQASPPDDPQNPAVVDIAAVKRFYFEHHVKKDGVRDKHGPKRAFAYLLEYLGHVDVEPKVAALTKARQQGFMKLLAARRMTNKTISTYLSYIKAGVRFCAKSHLIRDGRGQEREVQILRDPPHIDDSEALVAKVTGLPQSKPRDWTPTKAELAAMFDAMADGPEHEAVFRYMILALTWARPEAITELSVVRQVFWDPPGIIDLLPPGRVQNKKRRPRIRLTDSLRGWLLYWNLDKPITYYGRAVAQVSSKKTLKKIAVTAGVDPMHVNRYMLRHFMAKHIRTVAGVTVSKEERELWMGHADPKHKQTAWYEGFDPDYLEDAKRATDAIMLELNQLCRRRSLLAPNVARTAVQFSVITGDKTGT